MLAQGETKTLLPKTGIALAASQSEDEQSSEEGSLNEKVNHMKVMQQLLWE